MKRIIFLSSLLLILSNQSFAQAFDEERNSVARYQPPLPSIYTIQVKTASEEAFYFKPFLSINIALHQFLAVGTMLILKPRIAFLVKFVNSKILRLADIFGCRNIWDLILTGSKVKWIIPRFMAFLV